jgi:hypothetical protein
MLCVAEPREEIRALVLGAAELDGEPQRGLVVARRLVGREL